MHFYEISLPFIKYGDIEFFKDMYKAMKSNLHNIG